MRWRPVGGAISDCQDDVAVYSVSIFHDSRGVAALHAGLTQVLSSESVTVSTRRPVVTVESSESSRVQVVGWSRLVVSIHPAYR